MVEFVVVHTCTETWSMPPHTHTHAHTRTYTLTCTHTHIYSHWACRRIPSHYMAVRDRVEFVNVYTHTQTWSMPPHTAALYGSSWSAARHSQLGCPWDYTFTYLQICVYIHTHIYIYTYTYVYVCICVYNYTSMQVDKCMYIYVCVYKYVYIVCIL